MSASNMKSKWLGFTLAWALTACGTGNLPDYVKLGDLRVLALKADLPEVDPATSPTPRVTPVVSDFAQGRNLSYSATGCIDPGVGYGAKPTCAGVAGATLLASGTNLTLVPNTATHTGEAPAFDVPIPTDILTGRNPVDQFNGVAYLVVYTLTATNSDGTPTEVVSYKRIIASAALHAPKNSNPVLASVTAGAQDLGSYISALTFPPASSTPVALTPAFGAGSAEAYSLLGTDGTPRALQETLTTTWFISDGSLAFYRTTGTDSDSWAPPSETPKISTGAARGVFFVVVTRDGRGGEDYRTFE
jgi:hypothetical protein